MNPAAALLDFLAALTIAASCVTGSEHDLDDAAEAVTAWWRTEPGERVWALDGRALTRLADDHVFRCEGCERYVSWEDGAADDMPEHCTDCWLVRHMSAARAS